MISNLIKEMIGQAKLGILQGMKEDRLTEFYSREEFENAHMIGYLEQMRIFGKIVDYNYLLEANRKLLKSHFLFYNAAFDSLWQYKYSILALRCLYLAGKDR